ncbi:protein YgfX [uncultured Deefgea sp.]|uniref:protein YgfX n=1 Tax=uncultured Deefgea sp. TaxID=1304914 RepID=UPI00260956FB|nr:protein YgfX [uncultured Deefgea sp.]
MLPIDLQINPASFWRRGFLLLIFLLAIAACLVLQADWALLLAVFLLGGFVFYWAHIETIVLVRACSAGDFQLFDAQGGELSAHLLPSSVVTPLLIVLHFEDEFKHKINLVLWPDSAPVESLRQWRVWLRWVWSERCL